MSELKLCPFCGEHDRIAIERGLQDSWVGCDRCGARTGRRSADEDAVAAWNKRKTPATHRQPHSRTAEPSTEKE